MREIPASQLREGILRMLSDKSKLRTLLLSDDLDIRHKLQNILITISMAGCAASVVISFATQMSLAGNLASLLGLLTLSLAFYLSVIRKKKEAAYYLITIAVNLVLFPLMYMLNGGGLQRNAPLARIRAGVPVVRDGRRQVLRDVRA